MENQLKTTARLAAGSLILALVAGCALMKVRDEVEYAGQAIILAGSVSSSQPCNGAPIIVAAYSKTTGGISVVHYAALHEPGPYELMVPVGTRNIVAFADQNKNLIYDKGEPAGQILNVQQSPASAGGVDGNQDIVLSVRNRDKIDFPSGDKVLPEKRYPFHSTCPGAIINLDDELFSDEYGQKGFWAPIDFFREVGGNIYFLEEYDPNKIPILFVHGASGSPQNWRTFFDKIDRDKYQPWIFYYPSGASLDSMSYLLFWKLQNLQIRYKFKKLYITAHSMGGLVTRSFLVNYGRFFRSITTFISISTPWGGEELAEVGVKYSPGVVPAWRDMQPQSEFIKSIFAKHMPPTINHYLFFSHLGNRNILRPNNDRAVTLASQLNQQAQQEAKMVFGFNEDHTGILSSQQVIDQYNAILADADSKTNDANQISGSRLRVDFSFDFPEESPRPAPALLLHPVDREQDETWILLNPNDSGLEHGPFPEGTYKVSMVAPAFEPDPVSQTVRIDRNTVPRIRILMKPTGFLRGYIIKAESEYVQAGKYRQRDTTVPIESITLKGNGISRTIAPQHTVAPPSGNHDPIIPLQEEDTSYSEYYLSKKDFASDGIFAFFGLPAGRYELIINANGYEPYSESYDVQPGQYRNTLKIELIPDNRKQTNDN